MIRTMTTYLKRGALLINAISSVESDWEAGRSTDPKPISNGSVATVWIGGKVVQKTDITAGDSETKY